MNAFEYSAISVAAVLALMSAAPSSASASPVGLDISTFETIAVGHAVDQKCRKLSSAEREDLATHAAYAETAAVKKNGSGSVMAVRKRASAAAKCDGSAKSKAMAGLKAGRNFEQLYVNEAKSKVRSARKARKRKKNRSIAGVQPRQKPNNHAAFATASARAGVSGSSQSVSGKKIHKLRRFTMQTQAYYIQRRCRHLPYAQDLSFWKMIAASHKRLVRTLGSGPVSRAQRRAKSAAHRARCGHKTEKQVIAGLRGVRRDVQRY